MYLCVLEHAVCVGGQSPTCGSSFPLFTWLLESNSGYQAWLQAPLAEPFHWPILNVFILFYYAQCIYIKWYFNSLIKESNLQNVLKKLEIFKNLDTAYTSSTRQNCNFYMGLQI